MDIKEAVKYVSSKFEYVSDNHKVFDRWRIMQEDSDGKFRGDCEDMALSSMYYACDKNIFIFFWKVIITHQYKLYHCKTYTGGRHAVGYADGLWFDNWTKEALPYKEFFNRTNHEHKYFYFMPIMFIPFIVGHLTRKRK